MIIKEKRWLSRLVAMLCVLTMVVGVLTPASVGVARNTVTKVTIKFPENITLISDDGYDVTLDEEEQEAESYKYQYNSGEKKVDITSKDTTLPDSIYLYADSDNMPEISVTQGDKVDVSVSPSSEEFGKWKITIKLRSVTGEVILNASEGKPIYTVNFTTGEGCYIDCSNSQSIKADEQLKFNVRLTQKERTESSVAVNGRVISQEQETTEGYDATYIIKNINENKHVIVKAIDKTFKVLPPDVSIAYTYQPNDSSENISYDGTYSFYVNPTTGYDIPIVYVAPETCENLENAKKEGKLLSPTNGNLYIYTGIQENKKIFIDPGDEKKYNISFDKGTGYTITGQGVDATPMPDMIETTYNKDVKFEIKTSDGYAVSRVTANSNNIIQVLPETEGIYTLSKVTADTVISVVVSKESYDITYPTDAPGFKIASGAASAGYGDFVTFSVIPDEGYETPEVSANITNQEVSIPVISLGGNQYRITVTKPTTIKVGPVAMQKKTVTFNTGTGYSFFDSTGQDKLTTKQIEYGKEITFKLKIDDNYNQSIPAVTVNGITVTTLSKQDGYYEYTIKDIKEDKLVEVTGLEKNKYTVTLKSGTGYTLSTTESTQVSAGDKFSFSWKVDDSCTAKNLNITGQEPESITGNNGNKTITVTEDTQISLDVEPVKCTVQTPDPTKAKVTVEDVNPSNGEIPYNGSYSFTVKAYDYYKVDKVKVNNVPILPVDGVYTINNITGDNKEITVETSPVVLTIEYVDEKFDENTKTMKYSIENENSQKINQDTGVIELLSKEELKPSVLYDFKGWIPDSVSLKDYEEDTTITLKANWELKNSVIDAGLKLNTTGSWSGSASNYKLLFKTVINVLNNETEYKDNVKISACGTLYAASNIENPTQYVDKIKDRRGVLSDQLYKHVVDDSAPVYDYYQDIKDLYVRHLGECDFFSLSLTSTKKAERHAVGWLELEIDGKTIIIFGEDCKLPAN